MRRLIISGLVTLAGCAAGGDQGTPDALVHAIYSSLQTCDMARVATYLSPKVEPRTPAQVERATKRCRNGELRDEVTAFGMATDMRPELRNGGTLAVYDLTGSGISRPEIRLIKVAGKWYTYGD